MAPIWRWALAAILVGFVACGAASGQSISPRNDFDTHVCLTGACDSAAQAVAPVFDPSGNAPNAVESSSAIRAKGRAIVFYVIALELILAGIVAVACWLVLFLAGICVGIEERPAVEAPSAPASLHPSPLIRPSAVRGGSVLVL